MARQSPALPGNRLSRWLATVAGALALVAGAVLGAFVFLALLGIAAVAALVIAVRLAALRRRLRRAGAGSAGARQGGTVGDAEYVVLERRPPP